VERSTALVKMLAFAASAVNISLTFTIGRLRSIFVPSPCKTVDIPKTYAILGNMKKNEITYEDPLIICVRLQAKFPQARCWYEGQQIYIRYATGLSEYLTIPQASKLLR